MKVNEDKEVKQVSTQMFYSRIFKALMKPLHNNNKHSSTTHLQYFNFQSFLGNLKV